jgi:putative DNA primase/helicase
VWVRRAHAQPFHLKESIMKLACPYPFSIERFYRQPDNSVIVEFQFPISFGDGIGVCRLALSDFLSLRHLKPAILDMGYSGPIPTSSAMEELRKWTEWYARTGDGIKRTVRVAEHGGWTKGFDAFLLGNTALPADAVSPPFTSGQDRIHVASGSLVGWQNEVAALATRSTTMMLFLCAAFAAPLLRIAGRPPGGFGFVAIGQSGTGKTTALRVANSVMSPHFPVSFDATIGALLETAQQYNDLCLVIDCIEAMSEKERNEFIPKFTYSLTTGTPRVRMKSYVNEKGLSTHPYRTVVLASEERLASSRLQRQRGEEVRLVAIPIPRNDGTHRGIVDVPDDVVPSAGYVQPVSEWLRRIDAGLSRHYGVALPVFIKTLIGRIEFTRRFVKRAERWFLTRPEFSGVPSDAMRIARHFALCFAAGAIAVKFRVLPWTISQLQHAIIKQAQNAIEALQLAPTPADNAMSIFRWLKGSLRKRPYSSSLSLDEINRIDALTYMFGTNRYLLVRSDRIEAALGLGEKEVATAVGIIASHNASALLVAEKGKNTIQRRIDGGQQIRFYAFRYMGVELR